MDIYIIYIWNLTRAILLVWWSLYEGSLFVFPYEQIHEENYKNPPCWGQYSYPSQCGCISKYATDRRNTTEKSHPAANPGRDRHPLPCNPKPLHSPSDPFCVPNGRGKVQGREGLALREDVYFPYQRKGMSTYASYPRIQRVLWKSSLFR